MKTGKVSDSLARLARFGELGFISEAILFSIERPKTSPWFNIYLWSSYVNRNLVFCKVMVNQKLNSMDECTTVLSA